MNKLQNWLRRFFGRCEKCGGKGTKVMHTTNVDNDPPYQIYEYRLFVCKCGREWETIRSSGPAI